MCSRVGHLAASCLWPDEHVWRPTVLHCNMSCMVHVTNIVLNACMHEACTQVGLITHAPCSLQDRLDKHALEYATQRAAEAEAAIVQMDVRPLLAASNHCALHLLFEQSHRVAGLLLPC